MYQPILLKTFKLSNENTFWYANKHKDLIFDTEGIDILGDRGIIRWRLSWGSTKDQSVRGVNIMRVKDRKIVEALGYVKA